MGMVNILISYMEVVEHLGWSTVVDNTRNTNASNPILERLVTTFERAMTYLTSISVPTSGEQMIGLTDFVI